MFRKYLTFMLALTAAVRLQAQSVETTDSLTKELQEVVITSQQPVTDLVGTTLVSSIAGSSLQYLGTCLDVLAQLPMLTVSGNTVTVIGKGIPEIYIDGRPMRDTDELQQLQSANIKKVELLMAPGAVYDSETKAVLRITTKRNFMAGLSLTERAEVAARRKWSANNMLDLNYRTGVWDIFATGTIARNNSLIKGTTTNTFDYDGVETVVGSSQHNIYPTVNGILKGGFNFSREAQSFGAYYRFSRELGSFKNTGTEWLDDEPHLSRDINRDIRGHSHLLSLYYDNTFGEKYNLHFDGDFRSSVSRSGVVTSYPTGTEVSEVDSDDKRKSKLWAGKLYISFPLWKGSFVAGTQESYTHTTLDYNMLNPAVEEYIPSSFTDARQTSAAAFASWSRIFGRLSVSAGLRYEYTDYVFNVNGERDDNASRTDNLLTPDVSLSWNFKEQAQAALSYRMTTVRPPYSQLTGSLSYVGKHEIEGGNPTLRDEKMHDVQLLGMWNNFMMQADFTRSLDAYAFVKKLYPAESLQLIMQPVNIDVSALNIYFIWSKNIGRWSPNFNIGVYRQWLEIDGTSYKRPVFSYYFENLITLPSDFMLTVNAYGQTEGDIHTNRFGATLCSIDTAVSKSFLNKSLQLRLSVTDLFNTANNDWSMNTCGVLVSKYQSYDRRGVMLSLTYRFHPRQSKYKGGNASETELKRL